MVSVTNSYGHILGLLDLPDIYIERNKKQPTIWTEVLNEADFCNWNCTYSEEPRGAILAGLLSGTWVQAALYEQISIFIFLYTYAYCE
jgi:hypothetical protein